MSTRQDLEAANTTPYGVQILAWLEFKGHAVVYCACPWAGKCIRELSHKWCGYYWLSSANSLPG